jgi:hypothetical protein
MRLTSYVSEDRLEFNTELAETPVPRDLRDRPMIPFVSQVVPGPIEARQAHLWAHDMLELSEEAASG